MLWLGPLEFLTQSYPHQASINSSFTVEVFLLWHWFLQWFSSLWGIQEDLSIFSLFKFWLFVRMNWPLVPIWGNRFKVCVIILHVGLLRIVTCWLSFPLGVNRVYRSYFSGFFFWGGAFLLKDNCFTILFQFLPFINIHQPQAYTCAVPLESPSHLLPHPIPTGCHRAPVWTPCIPQQSPTGSLFYMR